MIELVVIVIILIVIGCGKVYHATQRQAEKEREYVAEQEMCGCAGFCLAYAIVKAILILIAAGAIFYIFISLGEYRPYENPIYPRKVICQARK